MLTAGSAAPPPQQRWKGPSGTMWVAVIPKSNNGGSSCQLQVVITGQMVSFQISVRFQRERDASIYFCRLEKYFQSRGALLGF